MQQLNVGLAFVAGLLSFLSPCVLPLIPSYLSFVGGTSARQLESEGRARLSALVNTAFFVLGFSIVFVLLGAFFTVAIGALGRLTVVVNIVAGVIVVLLGLNFIFDFWRFLAFERRAHLAEKPTGVLGALLVGMAFGGGWAPCVGPILSSILLLAGTGGGTLQGIGLLFVYSIGLGVPFLVTGLFFSRARTLLDRLKPHLPTIKIASGLFRRRFGREIFDYRRSDALFHLVAARRNIHLLLLTVGVALDRPEVAFAAMAAWMVATLLFHASRYGWAAFADRG